MNPHQAIVLPPKRTTESYMGYIIVLQYTHVLCALLLSIGRITVAIKTTPRLFYLSVSDKVTTTYTSLLLSIFQYLAIYSYTASPVIDLPVVCTDFHLKNTYDMPLCPERLTNKFKLTWWYIYAFRCKKKISERWSFCLTTIPSREAVIQYRNTWYITYCL